MNHYQKLKDYICSNNKQIEKDLMELRFGCELKCSFEGGQHYIHKLEGGEKIENYEIGETLEHLAGCPERIPNLVGMVEDRDGDLIDVEKILGNPLELRHILQYCNKRGIIFSVESNSRVAQGKDEYYLMGWDYTKSDHKQEDKVYKYLLDYLTNQ